MTLGQTLAKAMREEAQFFMGSNTHKLLSQGANMVESFETQATDNITEVLYNRALLRNLKAFLEDIEHAETIEEAKELATNARSRMDALA